MNLKKELVANELKPALYVKIGQFCGETACDEKQSRPVRVPPSYPNSTPNDESTATLVQELEKQSHFNIEGDVYSDEDIKITYRKRSYGSGKG